MFCLNLNDSLNIEEKEVAKSIQLSGSKIMVSMSVADQYRAYPKIMLAQNWLWSWYIAEMLAKHAKDCDCDCKEGEDGTGNFLFHFVVEDVMGMAKALAEFAQVFDPENPEAAALIYDEAQEWLEKRGNSDSRFPELESNYREDAAIAEEYGGENCDDLEDY